MELIYSSIIAIKLSEFHIIREHSVGLRGIIGDNINYLMDNPLHVFLFSINLFRASLASSSPPC